MSARIWVAGTMRLIDKQLPDRHSMCDQCRELRKWADTKEEFPQLHARREARAGRLASALRALAKVTQLLDPAILQPCREPDFDATTRECSVLSGACGDLVP
jgi:hypothetical protein